MTRAWPVFGADLVAREERNFPCKGYRPDLALDRVGIQFECAVIQEPDQAGPMRQRVADIPDQRAMARVSCLSSTPAPTRITTSPTTI